jgi:hypothetical protein
MYTTHTHIALLTLTNTRILIDSDLTDTTFVSSATVQPASVEIEAKERG